MGWIGFIPDWFLEQMPFPVGWLNWKRIGKKSCKPVFFTYLNSIWNRSSFSLHFALGFSNFMTIHYRRKKNNDGKGSSELQMSKHYKYYQKFASSETELLNMLRKQLGVYAVETSGVAHLQKQTVLKCLQMAVRVCFGSKSMAKHSFTPPKRPLCRLMKRWQ